MYNVLICPHIVFFFQAEDGIRDVAVTGVQTCALPILSYVDPIREEWRDADVVREGLVVVNRDLISLVHPEREDASRYESSAGILVAGYAVVVDVGVRVPTYRDPVLSDKRGRSHAPHLVLPYVTLRPYGSDHAVDQNSALLVLVNQVLANDA